MQRKKGISLIVLVITIIVMVVLAGAIIVTLTNSGIIERAKEARDKANLNEVKEAANLLWSEAFLNNIRDQEGLEDAVINGLTAQKVDTTKYTITVTTNGVTVELKEDVGDDEEEDDDTTGTQLFAPIIEIGQATLDYLSISGVKNASYELYEKGTDNSYTLIATQTSSDVFILSELELAVGDHIFVVKAKAEGYRDSDYSNEVTYTKGNGYIVTLDPTSIATLRGNDYVKYSTDGGENWIELSEDIIVLRDITQIKFRLDGDNGGFISGYNTMYVGTTANGTEICTLRKGGESENITLSENMTLYISGVPDL